VSRMIAAAERGSSAKLKTSYLDGAEAAGVENTRVDQAGRDDAGKT
jgi:hypothetical protein